MIAALAATAAGLVPLALDGEAAVEIGGNGTAIGVLSAISIAAGYLLLFALWRYVFSAKAKAKRGEPPEH
jgi:hypothetical protein